MSNIKKIIGVMLAIVMAFSVASIAFAAEDHSGSFTITFDASAATISESETATIDVYVTTTYKTSVMSIPVFYNTDEIEVVSVTVDPSLNAETENAATYVTKDSGNDYAEYFNGQTNTDKDGLVALVYIPGNGDTSVQYTNKKVMTIVVKAAAGATGEVTIACDAGTQKTSSFNKGKLYVGKNDSGSNTIDTEGTWVDTAVLTGATATFTIGGAAGDPELILTELGEEMGTVIDTSSYCEDYDGYVYGIDTLMDCEDIADFVTVINGTMEVVENENGMYSTGAEIIVKDINDDVVATYVFVYFGDVDGDGSADASDSALIEDHAAMIEDIIEGTAMFMAADIEVDCSVDASDSALIEDQVAMIADLPTQYELAAMHAELL